VLLVGFGQAEDRPAGDKMRFLRIRPRQCSHFGDFVIVAFLLVQALDGVFTYVGLAEFGKGIEGNPLITSLLLVANPAAALALVKLTAAGFGITLHVAGVHRTVALLTAFYVAVALVPWAGVLF
jgi:hypothetical protein